MVEKTKLFDIITFFISLITLLVPFIFLLMTSSDEVKIQTYLIFGIILVVVVVGVFLTYIISKWKEMKQGLFHNKKEIEEIRKEINLKEIFNKMDLRISVLEAIFKSKNKKGQIDPRILWWIILLILLYLFLKSVGFFN